jgi:hypothetical protein
MILKAPGYVYPGAFILQYGALVGVVTIGVGKILICHPEYPTGGSRKKQE